MSQDVVFFMYHELQAPARELCDNDPGYVRYVVTEDEFRDQLATLRTRGWHGWNVSEALNAIDKKSEDVEEGVCLTFDDGCATDLLAAAPLLSEEGFNATFYVTVDHLGRRGYLTKGQLRELSELGFEVGSHSLHHQYLTDLPADLLRTEIFESKERLEQITGRRVAHFSCPGGRTNRHVAQQARDAGYDSVITSRVGVNRQGSDRFALRRVVVKHDTSRTEFERLCRGEGFRVRQAETAMLDAAKRVFGNTMYERIRSTILGRGPA